jgi:hypothetical protein
MNELSYQPAFDAYHAVFRILRLREAVLHQGPLHSDHLKILDFYLLFPFRLAQVRFKREHTRLKKVAHEYDHTKPYGELPEDRVLLSRMDSMQRAALNTLAANEFLNAKELSNGMVAAASKDLPSELTIEVAKANESDAALLAILTLLARDYDLLGPNGLKNRTDLLEYRYDAV